MLPVAVVRELEGSGYFQFYRHDHLSLETGQILLTINLINIFFIIKDQPLPDSRQDVVPWATQNSAAMKKCL